MCLILTGCSSGDATPTPTADRGGNSAGGNTAGGRSSDTAPGTAPQDSPQARRRDEVWVDADGRKWFGNIPYDVFFDEPYTVAANQTPLAGGLAANHTTELPNTAVSTETPAVTSNGSSGTEPADTVTAESSPGDFTWDQLIEAQTLDDEVKSIRNFLNENLQTVGNYNSSMLMIPPKAATLSVLAGVALQHPEDVTWKEDAEYIRDLAARMNSDTLQRGAKDQRRLLELYEAISDTLNRSRPAGLQEPAPVESFADVAEMRLVMMRMSQAEQRMRTEAGSEGAFTSNQDMVVHEASVLATLTHTVTTTGYGYEDDPKFVGYGQEIVNAAKSIVNSARVGDFATYELNLSKISTTCQACHSEYKND